MAVDSDPTSGAVAVPGAIGALDSRPDPPNSRPPPHERWRRVAATVAVLAAVATAAGAYLASRPGENAPAPAPATATGMPLAQQIVGFWKGRDAAFPDSIVFRADGTVLLVSQPEDLTGRRPARTGSYRVAGDVLKLSGAGLGSLCDRTYAVDRLVQGWIRLTQEPPGPGPCSAAPPTAPFTLLRLSPSSQGGLADPPLPLTEIEPVRTTNPLYGTWLMAGTGQLMVVSHTGPPPAVTYRLDARGTIDSAAQDVGELTVVGAGRVVLHDVSRSACDTTLRSVAAGFYAITAHVESDPCRRFAGETALTWVLIQ